MLLLLSIYVYFKVYLYAISLKQCIFIQYKSTTKLVDFRFTACFYVTVGTYISFRFEAKSYNNFYSFLLYVYRMLNKRGKAILKN